MSTIRGYTSLDRVEHHTGRTFTDAQRAEGVLLLPVAEAWIDGYTGRTWGTTAPIVGEAHRLGVPADTGGSALVWLKARPVASVQSVSVRAASPVGAEATALVAAEGYELLDATSGLLAIGGGYGGYLATIAYTPAAPVDPRVELAATLLCAAWIDPVLIGASSVAAGATSYQVGDVRITYAQPTAGADTATATGGRLGVPDAVVALLKDLRGVRFA